MDAIIIKEKVCYHEPPKHTGTYTYILLYRNAQIFIGKIVTPNILVYVMCYTCKLYTMYLRVLNIYIITRPLGHP